nr:MAG TPA: hypothetical protein [Bacteriophage sp.]
MLLLRLKNEKNRSFLPVSAILLFDYICRPDYIFTSRKGGDGMTSHVTA